MAGPVAEYELQRIAGSTLPAAKVTGADAYLLDEVVKASLTVDSNLSRYSTYAPNFRVRRMDGHGVTLEFELDSRGMVHLLRENEWFSPARGTLALVVTILYFSSIAHSEGVDSSVADLVAPGLADINGNVERLGLDVALTLGQREALAAKLELFNAHYGQQYNVIDPHKWRDP